MEQLWKKKNHRKIWIELTWNKQLKNKTKPIKLFKTKTTSVVIIYLMDCMLQYLPSLVGVLGIHHHPMLERLYLKIPLLLTAHFQQNPDLSTDSPIQNKRSEIQRRSSLRSNNKKITRRNGTIWCELKPDKPQRVL